MKKLRTLLVVTGIALGSLGFMAPPASAVVCHDNPGQCCGGVTVLGKEILRIDCAG